MVFLSWQLYLSPVANKGFLKGFFFQKKITAQLHLGKNIPILEYLTFLSQF